MAAFFEMLRTLFVCGTVLLLAFLYAIHLPESPAKALVMKALTIAGCLLYVVSPVDLLPEVILGPLGLLDDAVALWVAAKTGYQMYSPTTTSPKS